MPMVAQPDASQELLRTLALHPNNVAGWVQLARMKHALRSEGLFRLVEASQALETALRLSPATAEVWDMAADAYHELSRDNFTYAQRTIECCQASLRLKPHVTGMWTNMAKVLSEAGRHREALHATSQALHLDGSFHVLYQHAEALTAAKQHALAQTAYRRLIRRQAEAPSRSILADVYNHLAVSLSDMAAQRGIGSEATWASAGTITSPGASPSKAALKALSASKATERLGEAFDASRAALRLEPQCAYNHAQNYHQVLAVVLHQQGRLDLATAALWPVAAKLSAEGSTGAPAGLPAGPPAADELTGSSPMGGARQPDDVAYLRAGFHVIAWTHRRSGDADRAAEAIGELEALGSPWHVAASSRTAERVASSREALSAQPRWARRLRERTLVERAPGEGALGERASGVRTLGDSGGRARERGALDRIGGHDADHVADRDADSGSASTQSSIAFQVGADGRPVEAMEASTSYGATHAAASSSTVPPSGVIVYLCCADAAETLDLSRSIRYLFEHFNGRARYPVVVFHDMLTAAEERALHRAASAGSAAALGRQGSEAEAYSLAFVLLSESEFGFPDTLSATDRASLPRSIRGFGMGYRHMCRFFSGPLFAHRALSQYDYVWRLDTDSFLLGTPVDPFIQLDTANASYAWIHAFRDEPVFVTGLWDTTARFLLQEGINVSAVNAWLPVGEAATSTALWPQHRMCFATNFFVARRAFFLSAAYQRYLSALDAVGGFYKYRWGDACVHMLAVAALLPRSQVLQLRDVAYWHQGTVILPAAYRAPSQRFLTSGLPEPRFASTTD